MLHRIIPTETSLQQISLSIQKFNSPNSMEVNSALENKEYKNPLSKPTNVDVSQ